MSTYIWTAGNQVLDCFHKWYSSIQVFLDTLFSWSYKNTKILPVVQLGHDWSQS